MGQPRIIRLESPSATQNVVDNMNEDIFMPFDGDGNYLNIDDLGDYEYLGFDGENHVYADGKGKKFFANIGQGIKKGAKKVAQAGKWIGKQIKNLVTKWGKTIKENRTKRQANKEIKKAEKIAAAEKKALDEANKKNLAPPEKAAYVQQETQKADDKIEQSHEMVETKIAEAETKAYNETLATTKNVEAAEKMALEKGQEVEKRYEGYLDKDPSFWGSMSTGAKIGLIGGGVVVLGLIIWGVIASSKK